MTRSVLLAACAAVTATALPARAQQPPPPPGQSAYARAQALVDDALGLQRAGRFDTAYAMLREGVLDCDADPDDAGRCRDLMYFSLGYLLQHEVRTGTDDPSLLDGAIAYYTRVAAIASHDTLSGGADPLARHAAYNLALLFRESGPHEWQEPLYRLAPHIDDARRGLHLTFLGDYYASTRRWPEALAAYRAAAQAEPDDAAPRVGMLDVYRGMGAEGTGELLALAGGWEFRFPELAAQAYRHVIVTRQSDDEHAAAEALVRYVDLLSRSRGAGADLLAELPTDWRPVADLAAYLAEPSGPTTAGWWLDGGTRARALARGALARGQREVAESRPETAERYWTAARELVDVTTGEAIDLKRELALLYVRHPALDPDGTRFDRLEQDLFHEKGNVLAARELEAAQRYHSMLGQIYAARGTWHSSRRGWNAIDQLTWALETAARRDAQHGFHQPLPELRSLLAEGYENLGDVSMARTLHGEAALAYLAVDDIDGAAAALPRSVEPGNVSPLAPLVELRARLQQYDIAAAERAPLCEPAAISGALAASRTSRAFVTLQRFKLLSDCLETGPPERRIAYGAEAMLLLVENDMPLTGVADVLRLENATAAVRQRAVIPDFEAHIDAAPHTTGANLRTMITAQSPGYVSIPDDAVIAAQVVRLMGPQPAAYRIEVRGGAVTFPQDPGRLLAERTDEIARLRGVNSVGGRP